MKLLFFIIIVCFILIECSDDSSNKSDDNSDSACLEKDEYDKIYCNEYEEKEDCIFFSDEQPIKWVKGKSCIEVCFDYNCENYK